MNGAAAAVVVGGGGGGGGGVDMLSMDSLHTAR